MTVQVKICGLKTKEALDTAIKNGANLIGFVFFENSPRNVSLVDAADFCQYSQGKVERVGLMVNPNDEFISAILNIVSLDLIQLHGSESPSRVSEIKTHFRVPIMKACSIVDESDVKSARTYENVADRLLFDAKSPKYSSRPGGNAIPFDWTLLAEEHWTCPWFLAGGLTRENVIEAISITGAPGVDVSSGVEDLPGEKNSKKIADFLNLVKG